MTFNPSEGKTTLMVLTMEPTASEFLWEFSRKNNCQLVLCDGPLCAFEYLSQNPPPKVILFDSDTIVSMCSELTVYLQHPHFAHTMLVILSDIPHAKRPPFSLDSQTCYLNRPFDSHILGGLAMLLEV